MTMNVDSFCEELNVLEVSEPEMAQGYDVISHCDLFFFFFIKYIILIKKGLNSLLHARRAF